MKTQTVPAYAKLNLTLDILGKRDDGYHELRMVMQTVSLCDDVTVTLTDGTGVVCRVAGAELPCDERNLAVKAANAFCEALGYHGGIDIALTKRIPSEAGMAGGSADAAAVLRALDALYGAGLSDEKLCAMGLKLGADVPFCLRSRPAFVTGIGENLEHFRVHTPFYLLLVKPYKGVSTKVAFETLDFSCAEHPDCRKMRQALIANDYEGVLQSLGNTLEQSAFKLVPQIATIKRDLLGLGFDGALMSGSGSTVFALTRDPELLEKGAAVMRKKAAFIRKTELRPQEEPGWTNRSHQ